MCLILVYVFDIGICVALSLSQTGTILKSHHTDSATGKSLAINSGHYTLFFD